MVIRTAARPRAEIATGTKSSDYIAPAAKMLYTLISISPPIEKAGGRQAYRGPNATFLNG